jgi:repressor LexA
MALTKKQKDVLDFISTYFQSQGFAPTQKEIQQHFGFKSLGSVQDYIHYLTSGGYLAHDPHSVRGLIPAHFIQSGEAHVSSASLLPSTSKNHSAVLEIPLLGSIAAGVPIEAIEAQDRLLLPEGLTKQQPDYGLKVKGDSMIEAGIFPNDIALIKHQTTAQNGEIVVAIIEGEATLKRYFRKPKHIELHPENARYKPFIIKDRDFELRGKLVGLFRQYV